MPCLDSNGTTVGPGGIYLLSVQATLDLGMLVLIIVTNAFIIFSVLTSRIAQTTELWVSRASGRFIVNLAAADAWVALSTLYFLSFRYLCAVRDSLGHRKWPCLLRFFFLSNSHMTSAYSLAAIAIDRYFAVVHALRYRELMSYRRATAMILAVWLLPIVSSCTLFYWNNWTPTIECDVETVMPLLYICLVGMLTHGVIIMVVSGTHYRIHREALAVSNRRQSRESGNAFCVSAETLNNRAHSNKSARTVLLVTGCYIVCWTPYTVIYFIRMSGISTPALEVCFNLSHTFANINYMVNPFLYSWRNASVRDAIMRTFKRLGLFKKPQAVIGFPRSTVQTIRNRVFSTMANVNCNQT